MSARPLPMPPAIRVPFARPVVSEEARSAALRALESGWITTGPEVQAFESDFAGWVGAEHAVAVASCTAAIEIALRALDLPRGSRVLTPAMTFCGAVHAIIHAGHQPVPVDLDEWSLMPDAETTARAAAACGGADAMVVLHYAGHPAPVSDLALAAGLPLERVIEDAAHALGADDGVRRVGTMSAATCFSFYATKNLPIGEGGMITTPDPAVADRCRQIRLHGMSADAWRRYMPGGAWRYSVEIPGLKANMTDVQAGIGRAQLRHLDSWQERRQQLADLYDRLLAGVPGIRLPARPSAGTHAWHLYAIQVMPEFGMHRDLLLSRLTEAGIGTSVHFIPVHQLPYFTDKLPSEAVAGLQGADAVAERVLSLPFHQGLADDDVAYVCTTIAGLGRPPR